jgi:hypothetical protein
VIGRKLNIVPSIDQLPVSIDSTGRNMEGQQRRDPTEQQRLFPGVCYGLLVGLFLFALFCTVVGGVVAAYTDRQKIYEPQGDQYCSVYKRGACLDQCGCGFCDADISCYSRDSDYCDRSRWTLGDTSDCRIRYASLTNTMATAGYVAIGFTGAIVVVCAIGCCDYELRRRMDRRAEQARQAMAATVEMNISCPSDQAIKS